MMAEDSPKASFHFFRMEAFILFLFLALVIALSGLRAVRCAGARGRAIEEDVKININEAGAEELALLRGIGPKRAQALIARREAFGPFTNSKDLDAVRGISARLAAEIDAQIVYE
jgi:competence ComEA-like helix-hairpin-helix protein